SGRRALSPRSIPTPLPGKDRPWPPGARGIRDGPWPRRRHGPRRGRSPSSRKRLPISRTTTFRRRRSGPGVSHGNYPTIAERSRGVWPSEGQEKEGVRPGKGLPSGGCLPGGGATPEGRATRRVGLFLRCDERVDLALVIRNRILRDAGLVTAGSLIQHGEKDRDLGQQGLFGGRSADF